MKICSAVMGMTEQAWSDTWGANTRSSSSMFFINRGLTVSSLVSLSNPNPITSQPIPFLLKTRPFGLVLLSVFQSYLIEVVVLNINRSWKGGYFEKILHLVSEFLSGGNPFAVVLLGYYIAVCLSFKHMLLDKFLYFTHGVSGCIYLFIIIFK
jgi:hypothetical protein